MGTLWTVSHLLLLFSAELYCKHAWKALPRPSPMSCFHSIGIVFLNHYLHAKEHEGSQKLQPFISPFKNGLWHVIALNCAWFF